MRMRLALVSVALFAAWGCIEAPPAKNNSDNASTNNGTNNPQNSTSNNSSSNGSNGATNGATNSGTNNTTGAVCGDGLIEGTEQCDDGNVTAGDGCDDSCARETNWRCSGEPSSCCLDADDDGYGNQGDGCIDADCDDSDELVNPGATEVCNGYDDDCDQSVDEDSDVDCYTGSNGTEGVGECRSGTSYCVDGSLGPCVGEVTDVPETCNGLDDDCDGTEDDGIADLSCGVGACATMAVACLQGQLQQCAGGTPSGEVCFDGIDNDCDGGIDEGCDCVYVAPGGNDSNSGGQGDPLLTLNAAIAVAAQANTPDQVCAAAQGAGCSGGDWYSYNEDIVMVDGVSLYGGYEPFNWTRPNCHRTNIRSNSSQGLVFPDTVTSPTVIDGFEIEVVLNAGSNVSVVTVDGSQGAVLSNNLIIGPFNGQITNLDESIGVSVLNGATPILYDNAIQGGHGTTRTIGLYSKDSAPQILRSCQAGDLDSQGRCTGGCGPLAWGGLSIQGQRPTWPNPLPSLSEVYSVVLEDSEGALIDQSALCSYGGSTEVAGLKILGDADNVVVSRNLITAGGAEKSAGLSLLDCDGDEPWIVDNFNISAEDGRSGTSVAEGISSLGDCHPIIDSNLDIRGGREASADTATGVHCGESNGVASQCVIIGNSDIRGSSNGFPTNSTGVKCTDGACARIEGNRITGRAGIDVRGIVLDESTNVSVRGNSIEGGCGTTSATGLETIDAGARISNNVIFSGECSVAAAGGTPARAMTVLASDSGNELDVHSNHVVAGWSGDCIGTAIELRASQSDPPSGPRGTFRNNIIDPRGCNTSYGVFEASIAADPRFFENNALQQNAMTNGYEDEGTTALRNDAAIDGMMGGTATANTTQGCQVGGQAPSFDKLRSTSPCVDAGTATGAPSVDFEGDPRPQGGGHDIGPDEYVP